jgi:hypothetical protein
MKHYRLCAALAALSGLFLFSSCEQPAGLQPIDGGEIPPKLETGILLSVTVPDELALTGESRVLIETVEEDGFEPVSVPITGTVLEHAIPLPAGWYSLDVLLVETGTKSYKDYQEVEVPDSLEGEDGAMLPLSFEPETGAFQSESEYESQTGFVTIRTTKANSSGLKLSAVGGSGRERTLEMAVANGTEVTWFTVLSRTEQTLTVSGAGRDSVTAATDTADGDTPGENTAKKQRTDVFIVDTSSIAASSGGDIKFVITVSEPQKNHIFYTITLNIPSLVKGEVYFYDRSSFMEDFGFTPQEMVLGRRYTYKVGEAFDPLTVMVRCYYSDGSSRYETDYDVTGFDTSSAGTCDVQFFMGGQLLHILTSNGNIDSDTNTVTFRVVEITPRLFFDYGRRISEIDTPPGRYTVTEGRTLVIAPVLWRIPEDATFSWSVSGGNYTTNGEFLTFNPGTAAGNYDVTVTASFGGQSVSASTRVECVNSASQPSPSTLVPPTNSGANYAPGEHLWYPGSLGAFGGYMITNIAGAPNGVDNGPGYDIGVGGNAFSAWEEPGIVWVMKDENKNGVADDTWYELKGSISDSYVTRRYAVTYYKDGSFEDNLGRYGDVFPSGWWPEYAGVDKMTFVGTVIDYTNKGGGLRGYADVYDTRCDISNAVQVDGTPLDPPLDHIDFVKQHTGIFAHTTLGEISTETAPAGSHWSKSITGAQSGSSYVYSFVNNSSYDVNVYLNAPEAADDGYVVSAGQTLTLTFSVSQTYYSCNGGNITETLSGNTLTFADGPGG